MSDELEHLKLVKRIFNRIIEFTYASLFQLALANLELFVDFRLRVLHNWSIINNSLKLSLNRLWKRVWAFALPYEFELIHSSGLNITFLQLRLLLNAFYTLFLIFSICTCQMHVWFSCKSILLFGTVIKALLFLFLIDKLAIPLGCTWFFLVFTFAPWRGNWRF